MSARDHIIQEYLDIVDLHTNNSFIKWMFVTLASFIQACTLGNIMCFSLFSKNLAVSMFPSDPDGNVSDVLFIGQIQLAVFLGTGIFIGPIRRGMQSLCSIRHSNQPGKSFYRFDITQAPQSDEICVTEIDFEARFYNLVTDRTISVFGVILWAVGYGCSVLYVDTYSSFAWIYITCGGIGAGFLYWNMWILLSDWLPPQTFPTALPLAMLSYSIAPNLYVIFMSIALIGFRQVPGVSSIWYYVYMILASLLGVLMFIVALMLASSDGFPGECTSDPEYTSLLPTSTNRRKPKQQLTKGRTSHPYYFITSLLNATMLQMLYYIPYLYIPIYIGTTPSISTTASESDISNVVLTYSSGVAAGKISFILLFLVIQSTCGSGVQQQQQPTNELMANTMLYYAFAYGLATLLVVCLWTLCNTLPGLFAYVFFLGMCIGGLYLCSHVILFHSTDWVRIHFDSRVSFYSGALCLGQILISMLSKFVFVQIADRYIYFAIALAAAMCVCVLALLVMVQIQKRIWSTTVAAQLE